MNTPDTKVVTQHKVQSGYLVTCELKQVLVAMNLEEGGGAPWKAICYEFQSIDCMDESPAMERPFGDKELALEFAKLWVKGEYVEGKE